MLHLSGMFEISLDAQYKTFVGVICSEMTFFYLKRNEHTFEKKKLSQNEMIFENEM